MKCMCVCEGWRLTLGSRRYYLSTFLKQSLSVDLEILVSTDRLPSKLLGSAWLCSVSPALGLQACSTGPRVLGIQVRTLNGRHFTQ